MNKIIVFLLACLMLVSCNNNKQNSGTNSQDITVYNAVKQKRTDGSPAVNSLNGVSDDYLRWIDESMADLSEDIKAQGRQFNINPSVVNIYVLHTCELSPVQRIPSFKVRGSNYEGEIYAAEYVIWEGSGSSRKLSNNWIICLSDDETYVKSTSRYGYEHKFLYDYYPVEFEATKTHTEGINHPLITPRVK